MIPPHMKKTEILIGLIHPNGPQRMANGRWAPGDPRLVREVLTPKEWKQVRLP